MTNNVSRLNRVNEIEDNQVNSRIQRQRAPSDWPDVVSGVSCSTPDLGREEVSPWAWNPGRRLIRAIRLYARGGRLGGATGRALQKYAVIEYRFWSSVTSSEIPLNLEIGLGLLLPHPIGIVIHPNVKIGPNCLIFHQVTLGIARCGGGAPIIGGHVDIGAGAKILGNVTVGNHARIGANAVVLTDVPVGALAVGVPAVIHCAPAPIA